MEAKSKPELNEADVLRKQVEELKAQLAARDGSDLESLKAFLTREWLRQRVPYGHYDLQKPVISSYIGTINNDAGFLVDRTGNRRFLVCTIDKIDWAYADNIDVNQVWAQAKHIYDTCGDAWKLNDDDKRERDATNDEFRIDDPIEIILENITTVTGEPADFLKTADLLTMVQDRTSMSSKAVSMAISGVLKTKGNVTKGKKYFGTKQERGYYGIVFS